MKERKGSFDFISNCLIVAGMVINYLLLCWLLDSPFRHSHVTNNVVPEWFPRHPTLQSYVNLFSSSNTLRWLLSSVLISTVITALTILTSVLAAYAFAKIQLKGKKVLFMPFIATLMLPKKMYIVPPLKATQKPGISSGYTEAILLDATLSFGILLLEQHFEPTPDILRGVTRTDGASEWYIFNGIYAPLIKVGIATLITLMSIRVWNDYLWQLIQLTKGELKTIQLGVASTRDEQSPDSGLTMAETVYTASPPYIIFSAFQSYFTQGVTTGVVKEQRERRGEISILREKLKSHEPLAGARMALTDPYISETASSLDYDFIQIGTEYSVIDYKILEMYLTTVRIGGAPVATRVSWDDPVLIRRVLEQGPDGIIFPVTNTTEEARRAMESCLYPPGGKQGLDPIRTVKYGLEGMDGYICMGHKGSCRLVQIESKEGVRNLDGTLCNPYVDGMIIGTCDLPDFTRILNQMFDERNLRLIDEAVQTIERHRIPIGVSTDSTDPGTLEFWYDRGLTISSSEVGYPYTLSEVRQILDTIGTVFGSPPCV